MKKSNFFHITILVFLFSSINILFAQFEEIRQTRYSLYGGASLPQSEFSETSGEKGGYAKIGFCGMLESSSPIGTNMNWVSSISLAINSIDESAMEDKLGGIKVSADNYLTSWIMTGIGFEANVSNETDIYLIGQIGLLVSSFPDLTLSYGGESITQTTDIGTAFAYSFGGGLNIDKINIGIRFNQAEPEYEQSASYAGITNKVKVKMPATILELLIGVNF